MLDDCSNDNSVEILKEYAQHQKTSYLVVNEQNSGSTFKQWAKGISLAKGELVWIAESDDLAKLTFLEVLVEKFIIYQDLGMVCCRNEIINEEGVLNEIQPYWDYCNSQDFVCVRGFEFAENKMLGATSIVNVSACLFRRQVFDTVSFDNIKLKLSGDWLIYLFILSKYEIGLSNLALNQFRKHNSTVSNISFQNKINWFEHVEILRLAFVNNLFNRSKIVKNLYYPFYKAFDVSLKSHKFNEAKLLVKGISADFHISRIYLIFKLLRYYQYFMFKKGIN